MGYSLYAFKSYADYTQLYVWSKPDDRHHLNEDEECVKDIRLLRLSNFLLLNSYKIEVYKHVFNIILKKTLISSENSHFCYYQGIWLCKLYTSHTVF